MAENELDLIQTKLGIDITDAETGMGEFAGKIDQISKSFGDLSGHVKKFNLDIADLIQKEIKKIKALDNGTIGAEISANLKKKLEEALVKTIVNRKIRIIDKGKKQLELSLSGKQKEALKNNIGDAIVKAFQVGGFGSYKITLSQANRDAMKKKINDKLSESLNKNLIIDFVRMVDQDGKKVRVNQKFKISEGSVQKIYDGINNHITKFLQDEKNIDWSAVEKNKPNTGKLASIVAKMSESLSATEATFGKEAEGLLIARERIEAFKKDLHGMYLQVNTMAENLSRFKVLDAKEGLPKLSAEIESIRGSIELKLVEFIGLVKTEISGKAISTEDTAKILTAVDKLSNTIQLSVLTPLVTLQESLTGSIVNPVAEMSKKINGFKNDMEKVNNVLGKEFPEIGKFVGEFKDLLSKFAELVKAPEALVKSVQGMEKPITDLATNFNLISEEIERIKKHKDATLLKSVQGMENPITSLAANFNNITTLMNKLNSILGNAEGIEGAIATLPSTYINTSRGGLDRAVAEELRGARKAVSTSAFSSAGAAPIMNIGSLKSEFHAPVQNAIDLLVSRYPHIAKLLKEVRVGEPDEFKDKDIAHTIMGRAQHYASESLVRGAGTVSLNPARFDSVKSFNDAYKRSTKSGFNPKELVNNNDYIGTVLAHEIQGHIVDNFIRNSPNKSTKEYKEYEKLMGDIKSGKYGNVSDVVSRYAASDISTAGFSGSAEVLAELASVSYAKKGQTPLHTKFDEVIKGMLSPGHIQKQKVAAQAGGYSKEFQYLMGFTQEGALEDKIRRHLRDLKIKIDKAVDDYFIVKTSGIKKALETDLKRQTTTQPSTLESVRGNLSDIKSAMSGDELNVPKIQSEIKALAENFTKLAVAIKNTGVLKDKTIFPAIKNIQAEIESLGVNFNAVAGELQSISSEVAKKVGILAGVILDHINSMIPNLSLFNGGKNGELQATLSRAVKNLFIGLEKQFKLIPATFKPEDLKGMYTKLTGAVNRFLNEYVKMVAEKSFATGGIYTTRTSTIAPEVKKNIARKLGYGRVSDFEKSVPVLQGKDNHSLIMSTYMETLFEQFNKKFSNYARTSFNTYQSDLKNLNIPQDTTLIPYIADRMTRLQASVIRRVRKMIEEEFDLLKVEVEQMKVKGMSLGNTPGRTTIVRDIARQQRASYYGNQYPGLSYNTREFETNGVSRTPGGDTHSFMGSVVNTMRYMLAGTLMGAPMMALHSGVSNYITSDYEMEKARQNMYAKYRGTGQPMFQEEAENIVARKYGDTVSESEREKLVETSRQALDEYNWFGARRVIQNMGIRYGIDQGDMNTMYEYAARSQSDPLNATKLTRTATRMVAVERGVGGRAELTSNEAIVGMQAVSSQWLLNMDQAMRFGDMLIKASLINQASVKDVLQVQQKAGAAFYNNMKGVSKDEAFARSVVLASLSTEATGKTGNEMGTFWRNTFAAPFSKPSNVKMLEQMSTNPLLLGKNPEGKIIDIRPYSEKTDKDGRTIKIQKDAFTLNSAILEAVVALKRAGKQAEANELQHTLYQDRNHANMSAFANIVEKLEKSGKSIQSQVEDVMKSSTSTEIDSYIVGMSKTLKFKEDRLASSFQALIGNVMEEFKPQISSAMNILTNIIRAFSDKSGLLSRILGDLGRAIIAVLAILGARKLTTIGNAIYQEQGFKKDARQYIETAYNKGQGMKATRKEFDRIQREITDISKQKSSSYSNQRLDKLKANLAAQDNMSLSSNAGSAETGVAIGELELRRDNLKQIPGKASEARALDQRISEYKKLHREAINFEVLVNSPEKIQEAYDHVLNRAQKAGNKLSQIMNDPNRSDTDRLIAARKHSHIDAMATRRTERIHQAEVAASEIARLDNDILDRRNQLRPVADRLNTESSEVNEANQRLKDLREHYQARGARPERLQAFEQSIAVELDSLSQMSNAGNRTTNSFKALIAGINKAITSLMNFGRRLNGTNTPGGVPVPSVPPVPPVPPSGPGTGANRFDFLRRVPGVGGVLAGAAGGIAGGAARAGSWLSSGFSGFGNALKGLAAEIPYLGLVVTAMKVLTRPLQYAAQDQAGRAQMGADTYEAFYKRALQNQNIMQKAENSGNRLSALFSGDYWSNAYQNLSDLPGILLDPSLSLSEKGDLLKSTFAPSSMANSKEAYSTLQKKKREAEAAALKQMSEDERHDMENFTREVIWEDSNGIQRTSNVYNALSEDATAESIQRSIERMNMVMDNKQAALGYKDASRKLDLIVRGYNENTKEYLNSQIEFNKETSDNLSEHAASMRAMYEDSIQYQTDALLATNATYEAMSPEDKANEEKRVREYVTNMKTNQDTLNKVNDANTKAAQAQAVVYQDKLKVFGTTEDKYQIRLRSTEAESSSRVSKLKASGSLDTSQEVLFATQQGMVNRLALLKDMVREQVENLKNAGLSGPDRDKTLASIAEYQSQIDSLGADLAQSRFQGQLQVFQEEFARKNTLEQLGFQIQQSKLESRGLDNSSPQYKALERSKLLSENTQNATHLDNLRKHLNTLTNPQQRDSVLIQIREIEAKSQDNLAKIYKLQYEQSKVTLGLPAGVRPMTNYEYAASRNNEMNMSYSQGGVSVTVNYGDIYGADKKTFEDNVIKPTVKMIQAEINKQAGYLRNQTQRVARANYLRIQ